MGPPDREKTASGPASPHQPPRLALASNLNNRVAPVACHESASARLLATWAGNRPITARPLAADETGRTRATGHQAAKPPIRDRRLCLCCRFRRGRSTRGPVRPSGVCADLPARSRYRGTPGLGAAAARRGHMAAPVAPVLAAAIPMAAVLAAPLAVAPFPAALGRAAARLHPAARGSRTARLRSRAGRGGAGRSRTARGRAAAAHLAAAIPMAAIPAAPLAVAPLPAALGSAAGRLAPARLLTPAPAAQHGE